MKTKLTLILLYASLVGCEGRKGINDLPKPCVVRSAGMSAFDADIQVQCTDGNYYELFGGQYESYKVNDTIK